MRGLLCLVLLACDGSQDATPTPVDSGVSDTGDVCTDAPTLSYYNFGDGFLTENCQGCHASTAEYRYGAPESVTFDTIDQAWAFSIRILALAAGDDATMPPAGGVHSDDRMRLVWWLQCAEEGT